MSTPTAPRPGGAYWSLRAVAERFHVHEKTIRNWIETLAFPAPHRFGRTLRFDADAVESWERKHRP
jgi:excisionase family DNA binding protein